MTGLAKDCEILQFGENAHDDDVIHQLRWCNSSLIFFLVFQKCTEGQNKNTVLSPYSVGVALAFAAQGAAGTTERKLFDGLHLTGTKEQIADRFSESFAALTRGVGNSTLEIANKVYVQEGHQIKPAFADVAEKKFHSEAQSVNFGNNVQSAQTINQWVEEKTHDKIKDLISADSLSADSRVVLVNAIYFKGQWEHQFRKTSTQPGPFYTTADGAPVDVQYMNQKEHFNYGAFEELQATGLQLKYQNSDISFLIVLPDKRDGLAALEQKLQNVDFGSLIGRMERQEVQVKIPKFKIESKFDLKEPLTKVSDSQVIGTS